MDEQAAVDRVLDGKKKKKKNTALQDKDTSKLDQLGRFSLCPYLAEIPEPFILLIQAHAITKRGISCYLTP